MVNKEIAELERKIEKQETLLAMYEETMRVEDDPRRVMRLQEDIEETKTLIMGYRVRQAQLGQEQEEIQSSQKQNERPPLIKKNSKIDRKLLDDALQESFSRHDLQPILAFVLDVPLGAINEQGSMAQMVYDVINYFYRRDELERLIAETYKARPNNAKLRYLAEKHPYHEE